MITKQKTIKLAVFLAVLLVITAGIALADTTYPPGVHFVEDNPTCADLGDNWFEFKVEPVESGTYTSPDGYLEVTLDVNAPFFDWTSNLGIDAVIVKGGPDALLYVYQGDGAGSEANSDTGLHAPQNEKNGKYYGLSHVSFCYDFEVYVSKDAHTSFTRTYDWDITKDPKGNYVGWAGDSWEHVYTINVYKDEGTDSDWAVEGTIWIENNTPLDATIESVADMISPAIAATVDCGVSYPYMLMSGEMLACSYASDLPDGSDRVNTATVETSGMVGGGEATVDVLFAGATITEVFPEVNVTDNYGTPSIPGDDLHFGPAADDDVFTYPRIFVCSTNPADYEDGTYHYTVKNTATIDETGDWDDATVTVTCYLPTIEKTVETYFNRYYEWTIEKTVTPAEWDLFMGESGTSEYTITIGKDSYDSDWQVMGDITIHNPAPMALDLDADSVTDIIADYGPVDVDCPGWTVPAEGSLVCTYDTGAINAPDANPFGDTNYAAASYTNNDAGVFYLNTDAEIPADWGEPTEKFNENPTVVDTFFAGPFNIPGVTTYERTFFCGDDEGKNGNTVTLTPNDFGEPQHDSASVDVDCFDLTIDKTANPGYTVQYYWNIEKYVDDPGPITVYPGDSILADYTVEVWPDAQADMYGYYVSGEVTVTNNHPSMAAELISITDWIPGYGNVPLDCPSGWELLPAGDSVTCTYNVPLPGWEYYYNHAKVAQQLYDYPFEADPVAIATPMFYNTSVPIEWGNPTTVIDESIDVWDSAKGFLGTVTYPNSHTFTYSVELTAPYDICGLYEIPNEAWFVTNDNEATDNAFAYVTLDIVCATDGCTPGFWQGGAGSKLWDEEDDPDWTGEGTNPFTHEEIFNLFFDLHTDIRLDGQTMWQLVSNEGGIANSAERAGRTMVAAYLNESAFPGTYAYVDLAGLLAEWYAAVIGGDEALDAFHSKYDDFNNYGCPLP